MNRTDELLFTERWSGDVGNRAINAPIFDMIDKLSLYGKDVIEVGCHIGVLTEIFANMCNSVIAVDSWRDRDLKNKLKNRGKIWSERMSRYENVTQIIGDSVMTRRKVPDGSVDFVYIDARHTFRFAASDILAWLPKIKGGSWFGGHDYKKSFPGVIDAVNIIKQLIPVEEFVTFDDSSWAIKTKTLDTKTTNM